MPFSDATKLLDYFTTFGQKIRSRQLDLGRETYALGLALGVREALQCGLDKLTTIELGVATGGGLFDLCKAAAFFRQDLGIDIRVYGFDTGAGLPEQNGYRDHPELWCPGKYNMGNPETVRAQLPDFAELIIGDIGTTLESFQERLETHPLGFASIDLDYYSSTTKAMKLFLGPSTHLLPAVPLYFDDILQLFMYNEWCGEALAVKEFNASQDYRKIDAKPHFNIMGLHACHVLDHPIRQGKQTPLFPLMGRTI